jgi:hypothetical protein
MDENSASRRADMALQALAFYLSVERLIAGKVITTTSFLTPGRYSPAQDVFVNPVIYSQHDLETNAFNTKLLMVGAVTLTCDEALDDVFGKNNKDKETDVANVHAVIHQIRNCFAHNPLSPKWIINTKYRKKYEVVLSNKHRKTIDLTSLNGSPFKLGDVGGLNILAGMVMYAVDAMYKELGDEPA